VLRLTVRYCPNELRPELPSSRDRDCRSRVRSACGFALFWADAISCKLKAYLRPSDGQLSGSKDELIQADGGLFVGRRIASAVDFSSLSSPSTFQRLRHG
jgi:hypothetical protein